jgi:hypothetical protein
MHPAPRSDRMATVLLAVILFPCLSPGQEIKPADSIQPPKVYRAEFNNGPVMTVYYFVNGGTPRLRALYRTLQWAENEVTLVEHLQQLKLEYVNNERALEARHRAQVACFRPPWCWNCDSCYSESSLKGAMSGVLAQEATPQAAVQAIQMLERAEIEAADELKKLTPADRQGLRKRTEALHNAVAVFAPPQATTPTIRLALKSPEGRAIGRQLVVPSDPGSGPGISTIGVPARPTKLQTVDKDRQTLEDERQVLEKEREILTKEREPSLKLLRGSPAEREEGMKRLQAASERWSAARLHWSTACRNWQEVIARPLATQRAGIVVSSQQSPGEGSSASRPTETAARNP